LTSRQTTYLNFNIINISSGSSNCIKLPAKCLAMSTAAFHSSTIPTLFSTKTVHQPQTEH